MKNVSLWEKHLQHNFDVEKDTVNCQNKMQRNCNVISISSYYLRKNDVYLTLLEIRTFINQR